jgi:hypothetical protein
MGPSPYNRATFNDQFLLSLGEHESRSVGLRTLWRWHFSARPQRQSRTPALWASNLGVSRVVEHFERSCRFPELTAELTVLAVDVQ